MKLQLALDFITLRDAISLLEELDDLIDIAEAGTPFIIREGIGAVREMKQAFPHLEILVDLKIMDAGEQEAAMAFEAGADIITVLGVSGDETIAAAVKQAQKYGRKVMADMIGAWHISKRASAIERLGVDYICVHTAFDRRHTGQNPLEELRQLRQEISNAKAAVAGGIVKETLPVIVQEKPEIIIVGGGITGSPDKRQAAISMRKIMMEGAAE